MDDLLMELVSEGFTVTLEPWDDGLHVRLELPDPAGTIYAAHRLESLDTLALRVMVQLLAEDVRRTVAL